MFLKPVKDFKNIFTWAFKLRKFITMQIFELHNRATIDIIWILKKMSNFFAKVSNSSEGRTYREKLGLYNENCFENVCKKLLTLYKPRR